MKKYYIRISLPFDISRNSFRDFSCTIFVKKILNAHNNVDMLFWKLQWNQGFDLCNVMCFNFSLPFSFIILQNIFVVNCNWIMICLLGKMHTNKLATDTVMKFIYYAVSVITLMLYFKHIILKLHVYSIQKQFWLTDSITFC